MDITPETAVRNLWSFADKHERLRALDKLDRMLSIPDVLFWSTLWEIWESHESLYKEQDVIQHLLSSRPSSDPRIGMSEEDRHAFAALPDSLTVFRGCRGEGGRGWSWTLDRSVALRFATRAAGVHGAVVLEGVVSKSSVLAYLGGRNEREIVVAAKHITVTRTCDVPPVDARESEHSKLFQMAQEGGFAFPNEKAIMADLMFDGMIDTVGGAGRLDTLLAEAMPFCEALGLEKAEMLRRLRHRLDDYTQRPRQESVCKAV